MDPEPVANNIENTEPENTESPMDILNEPQPVTPNLDLLKDIELQVTLRFGSAQMSLKELAALGTGAVIELDRALADPVEVLVGGYVIARGEPIVVRGVYGIRISEIASHKERLTSSLHAADSGGIAA
jgi:flagellar motor switch protein FliN/FliY